MGYIAIFDGIRVGDLTVLYISGQYSKKTHAFLCLESLHIEDEVFK